MSNIYTGKQGVKLNIRRGQGSEQEGEKIFIHIVERDKNGKEIISHKSFVTGEYLRELVMNDMKRENK